MTTLANVNIWNKNAGAVVYDDTTGLASFEFAESFLTTGWDLSPIKMPLAGAARRVFSFPDLKGSATFKGLPGLLADALPDRYGNALINAWLAAQGRSSDSLNPVEILCFIGKRAMGALEFEPVQPSTPNTATKIEIGSLVQAAQDILSHKKTFPPTFLPAKKKQCSTY